MRQRSDPWKWPFALGVAALLTCGLFLLVPALNEWFFSAVFWFFDASGVPRWLVGQGLALTRFWSPWL